MGAIADLNDLLYRATGGGTGNPQRLFYYKNGQILGGSPTDTSMSANTYRSLWMYEGVRSGGSANPTSATALDNTTQGGLLQTDPSGGRQLWMVAHTGYGANSGYLVIYDRLLHMGGLDATSTSPQTVGGSITRNTNGAGNMVLVEVYTLIGSTPTTITGTYTDQDGNSSTFPVSDACTIGGGSGQNSTGMATPLPLAAGDTGVRGVTNVQLTNSTTTAGNFGVTIAHPIMMIPCVQNGGGFCLDYLDWIPEIPTDACLGMFFSGFTGTTVQMIGNIILVEA